MKKAVLKNFAKRTGKHLCWSIFLIKLKAGPATLLKGDCSTGFPVNFGTFLRTLSRTPFGDCFCIFPQNNNDY